MMYENFYHSSGFTGCCFADQLVIMDNHKIFSVIIFAALLTLLH